MTFFQSIKSCFSKYATFSGRASRSEFWWSFLFCTVILSATIALPLLAALITLAIALPLISVGIRRLHDIDRSGWWILVYPIPIIGNIFLFLIWNCRRGTEGSNRFDAVYSPAPSKSQPYSPTPAVSVTDKAEQLSKLKSLLEDGTITQDEFERMKAELLAS